MQDLGQLFGDRGNGFSYGWDQDLTADGRWRQNPNSPDLRYDYRVSLKNASTVVAQGEVSGWSLALAPSGFTAATVDTDALELSWDAASTSHLLNYRLERSLGGQASFGLRSSAIAAR